MSDLISRSAVLETINEVDISDCTDVDEIIDRVYADVASVSPVDAAPVVHARWIDPCINKYGHPCHHCSACGFKASQKDRNFCPNCGARMDGEADG